MFSTLLLRIYPRICHFKWALNFNRFLSQAETQFVIPVYQRNYDWTIDQCRQLLDDVLAAGLDKEVASHFIGSIVYVHDDVYSVSDVKELIVIDGQQRLTTITLMYLALYWLAIDLGDEQLQSKISDRYLINKYADEDSGKLKLKPTEDNDQVLQHLLRLDKDEVYHGYSRIIENFNFFRKKIVEENYNYVLQGLGKLLFVEISLDRHNDDPQRIFESLNSTGLELSQADLIRNYILMGLKRSKQTAIYDKYWSIIEDLAKDETKNNSHVSDFIRDFLTLKTKSITRQDRVYKQFKETYSVKDYDGIEEVLSELKKLAQFYNKLINPENESDSDIRKAIHDINQLSIAVIYPFLMQVYSDYHDGTIDKVNFLKVLDLVQSFVWRRVVATLPTNALNKIFMRLYEDVDQKSYVESIGRSLIKKKGTQRFPGDAEIESALREKDLYSIKTKNRTYFFDKIENYNNNEHVSIDGNVLITIEHIFPQNPEPAWKIGMEEVEFEAFKNIHLHTLGNLTLSGNNGSLSNKSFLKKRDMNTNGLEQGYKFSRLFLNRYLSSLDKWTLRRYKKRTALLTERFIEIWKYPEVAVPEDEGIQEANIFDAEDPTGRKLEYAIFFNEKIASSKTSVVYHKVLSQLFELQPESFFTTDLKEKFAITKNPSTLRNAKELNEVYFYEGNYDNKAKFERLKYALQLFGFEDELSVKYRE